MDDLLLINNTADYRNPAAQSALQGPNVMQPSTVYSKIMLRTIELAEADYTFDALATERTMPSNNGANEITFKRMLALAGHTQPLVEGIPPASDKGAMVALKGSTKAYGRVMKFTDKVNWAVVDPLISEYTRQLSLKVPELKDTLAQQALLAECGVYYAQPKTAITGTNDPDMLVVDTTAPAVTHITQLTTKCNPTIDEFRKIVLGMEAAKVRPHTGGNFMVLASSAVLFDLITDRRVKEYMKYAGTGEAYKNDFVVDLFSLVFRKAKTIKTDNTFIDGDGIVQYLYTAVAAADVTINLTPGAAATGKITKIPTGEHTIFCNADTLADTTKIKMVIAGKTYAYKESGSPATYAELTWADVKSGLTTDKLNVHHNFVIGEECLYRIGVEGHTQPQFIKKELGSAGTADPLNQRQSIGWKIDSLGYKVVNPDAVVDYMCIPSQYKININARPDLRNEYTDYYYGFEDAGGKYYHPDQVVEFGGTYKVRGTNTTVTPVKMTKLVGPVNGGIIDANGKKNVVVGDLPTMQFALAANHTIRFLKEQVVLHTDNKYYIKGMAGTSAAEVVALPQTYTDNAYIKADGTGLETRTALVEEGNVNKTGDDRIDG